MFRVGRYEISEPATCCSIIGKSKEKIRKTGKKAVRENAELLEIRLDKMEDFSNINSLFDFEIPTIATNRAKREGGHFEGDEEERIEILSKCIDGGASCIDIELSTKDELIEKITQKARDNNCSVILSYHDFEKVPSIENLRKTVGEMEKYDHDFKKIIGYSNSSEESVNILDFLIISMGETENNIITFAMGEKGSFTRVTAPVLGSPFTYASMKEKTAPGQLKFSTVKDILYKYKE
mgnify:CR=1 FL=1